MRSTQNWDLSRVGDISGDKLERNMREQMAFMDSDVRQMRAILKKYAPLEMMKLACWDRWRVTNEGDAQAACTASAFVRFLQNAYVLQQTYDTEAIHSERDIHTKDYKRLVQLFDDLVKRAQRYVDNAVLAAKVHSGVRENGIVEQMQIFASDRCFPPPQNERSIPDRARLLRMSLLPFQGAIDQAFHAGLDGIVEAFATLEADCMQSLRDLRKDTDDYQRDMAAKVKESKELGQEFSDDQERVDAIVNREHWHERIDSMLSRRDGYELYDVQKLTRLDNHDCEALSLDLASVEGTFSQYPFETRATADYPFVHGVTRYFCFDADHLLDDGYQIVKDHILNEGLLSSEEWEATEKESRLLQPVTIVHSLLGSMSFELRKDGYDAIFDFPERQIGLVVVNPVEIDPFEDGRGCMLEIANGLTRMGWVRNQRLRAIVVDGTLVGNYPLQLQDGVLYVTASQFLRITQEPETVKQCKALLDLAPGAEPCEELSEKQEESHDDESGTIGAESHTEPDVAKEPDVPETEEDSEDDDMAQSLAEEDDGEPEPEDEEQGEEEEDEDLSEEAEEDVAESMIHDSETNDDDLADVPTEETDSAEEDEEHIAQAMAKEVQEETPKPQFSLFSLLNDISKGNDHPAYAPVKQEATPPESSQQIPDAEPVQASEPEQEENPVPSPVPTSSTPSPEKQEELQPDEGVGPVSAEEAEPVQEEKPAQQSPVSLGSLLQGIATGPSASSEGQEELQPDEGAGPVPAEDTEPEQEAKPVPGPVPTSSTPSPEKQEEPQLEEDDGSAPAEEPKPVAEQEAKPAPTPFSLGSLLQGIATGSSASSEGQEEPQPEEGAGPAPAEESEPEQEANPAPGPVSLGSLLQGIATGSSVPSEEREEPQPEEGISPGPVEKSEPEAGTEQAAPVAAEADAEDASIDAPLLEDLVSASPIDVALGGKQIPARLREILEKQGLTDGAFFTLCKEGSDKLLDASCALIDKALLAQSQDGKDKMFTISKYALTFVIASRSDDELSRYDRKENIGAMMYVDGKDSWNSITLFYDKEGELRGVDTQTIKQADYSQLEWKYATNIGERIIARRKQQKG